ncbi:MAG: DUF1836 domain-containing protein [Clostridiales bacterium]|nr:DUF1836 domain-containing protein [Clostridiales bacterium]
MQHAVERMTACDLAPWEGIPDLGLYMDQVITYVERQLRPLYGDQSQRLLTPAMVNNYVKSGLIPRPSGKKYDRPHLAMLLMVATLKQAASIEDVSRLIGSVDGEGLRVIYENFRGAQQRIMAQVAQQMPQPGATAMKFAIEAVACRLACEALLGEQARPATE